MYRRQYYFSRFAKSHPVLRLVNIYDRQSFVREWILDNIYICILTYLIFYLALWYANKVIRRIEKSNEKMHAVVADNRQKLDDVVALRGKRQEYEEVVMKVRAAQRVTGVHLEAEIKKLHAELTETFSRLDDLEKLVDKRCKPKNPEHKVHTRLAGHCPQSETLPAESVENVKVLEPSFPPRGTHPRKYGISVPRQREGDPRRVGIK